jgi:hypothetical protein
MVKHGTAESISKVHNRMLKAFVFIFSPFSPLLITASTSPRQKWLPFPWKVSEAAVIFSGNADLMQRAQMCHAMN